MTPEKFKNEMIAIAERNLGLEGFHLEADDLICKVMRELGYSDGIEIFEKHEKWYA